MSDDFEWALMLGIDDLEEDMKAQVNTRVGKTEDEIEKFLIDESLNEIEKAEWILR